MKFYAHMGENMPAFHCSDARRFSTYVKNVRFWFAIHRPVECSTGLTISHWDTGMKVCSVSAVTVQASAGMNWADIGRAGIERLCFEKGSARVYDVLTRAEKAGYGSSRVMP